MKKLAAKFADKLINYGKYRVGAITRTGESFDVVDVAFWRAANEAAEFYETHLIGAKSFTDTLEMMREGVRMAPASGLFLEFGVATGRTIRAIAEEHLGPVYGFDSFEGLPEDWYGGYGKGHFATDSLPSVPPNVELIKGWFSDTLPGFLEKHPGPVSFVNVDCDLYSSTRDVLHLLCGRFQPGTVIQFDEYFNYPGWRNHEYRAFQELVSERGLKFRYHSFLRRHQAVCVVIGE
jgi:hypothetical protein